MHQTEGECGVAHDQRERIAVVSPQADSCQLETNPERARDEPSRCSDLTRSGVHVEGLVPTVRFSNNMCTVSKQAGRYQRNERVSRLLQLLLAAQGKALLEGLDPCCWRVSCKLVVEDFQDAILLSDDLLGCPPCVQRRCGVGLAPGKESCDCRKQIGQQASGLLRTLSRRRIHFNKDVDSGARKRTPKMWMLLSCLSDNL